MQEEEDLENKVRYLKFSHVTTAVVAVFLKSKVFFCLQYSLNLHYFLEFYAPIIANKDYGLWHPIKCNLVFIFTVQSFPSLNVLPLFPYESRRTVLKHVIGFHANNGVI